MFISITSESLSSFIMFDPSAYLSITNFVAEIFLNYEAVVFIAIYSKGPYGIQSLNQLRNGCYETCWK